MPLAGGRRRRRCRGHRAASAVAERRDHLLELALADHDLDAHRAAHVLPGQEAPAVVQLLERLRRGLRLLVPAAVGGRVPREEAPGRHRRERRWPVWSLGRRVAAPTGDGVSVRLTPALSPTFLASYSTKAKAKAK